MADLGYKTVYAAAARQDTLACTLLDDTCRTLALALGNVIALLHPERIIIPFDHAFPAPSVAMAKLQAEVRAFADEHGIRSPRGGRLLVPTSIDLVVVPALAYDVRGNRLGRGGAIAAEEVDLEAVSAQLPWTPAGLIGEGWHVVRRDPTLILVGFVVFFLGIFWKRLNGAGCLAALIVGFLMGPARLAVDTPVKPSRVMSNSPRVPSWSMPVMMPGSRFGLSALMYRAVAGVGASAWSAV